MTSPTAARPQSESLVRAIGTFGLAAGIINITIGGRIFRLPANVAATLGAAAPLAYLVCAVAMGLIVYCIADAGRPTSPAAQGRQHAALPMGADDLDARAAAHPADSRDQNTWEVSEGTDEVRQETGTVGGTSATDSRQQTAGSAMQAPSAAS